MSKIMKVNIAAAGSPNIPQEIHINYGYYYKPVVTSDGKITWELTYSGLEEPSVVGPVYVRAPGVRILDVVPSIDNLPEVAEAGDCYGVGTTPPFNYYIYNGMGWIYNGQFVLGYFTPSLDENGNLSWSNNLGLENPPTTNIVGENGRGIVSIALTSGTGEAGTIDTYTITYTDETTDSFTIRNGNGADALLKVDYDPDEDGIIAPEQGGIGNGEGDTAELNATFEAASERINILTGETHATLFGKIKKWFTDLGTLAFKNSIVASDITNASITNDKIAIMAPATVKANTSASVYASPSDVSIGTFIFNGLNNYEPITVFSIPENDTAISQVAYYTLSAITSSMRRVFVIFTDPYPTTTYGHALNSKLIVDINGNSLKGIRAGKIMELINNGTNWVCVNTDVVNTTANSLFLTSGTAPNFTIDNVAINAYTYGLRLILKFHAAGTNATININGLGAKAIYEYSGKQLSPKSGQVIQICYDGTYFFGVSVGGVEFPTTPSAGDTPIKFFAPVSQALTTSYADINGRSITIKRAGTYRLTYSVAGAWSYNTTNPYAQITKNGVAISGSGIIATAGTGGPSAGTVIKTIDVTCAENDVLVEQAKCVNTSFNTLDTHQYLCITMLASDVQAAINEILV